MANLGKFHGATIFGAVFLALMAVLAYAALTISEALQSGVLEQTGRDAVSAESPTRFWIGIGWRAVGGLSSGFFALRIAIVVFRMHKRGALFVPEPKKPEKRLSEPLIEPAHTSTIEYVPADRAE